MALRRWRAAGTGENGEKHVQTGGIRRLPTSLSDIQPRDWLARDWVHSHHHKYLILNKKIGNSALFSGLFRGGATLQTQVPTIFWPNAYKVWNRLFHASSLVRRDGLRIMRDAERIRSVRALHWKIRRMAIVADKKCRNSWSESREGLSLC